MDNPKEFRLLSLCSGYGGLELGLGRVIANLRTVAYVEVEAFACANLVAKMEQGQLDVAPIWTDIKTFDAKPFRNKIHIITAGYPCQPFSAAGKRQGAKDPRYLWPDVARVVRQIKPQWCFFENVRGHLSRGFAKVYCDLRKMGYAVEMGLFTAAEIGAPHFRHRLFILAHDTGCGLETVQIQQKGESAFRQGCGGLANAENPDRRGTGTQANARRRDKKIGRCFSNQWPARPGQPQHEWEEPRVVADTGKKQAGGLSQSKGRLADRKAGNASVDYTQRRRHKPEKGQIQTGRDSVKYTDKGQTQSQLGGAVDGTACRVDRLRLLGNGVVPQQAEKAFRELIRLFE